MSARKSRPVVSSTWEGPRKPPKPRKPVGAIRARRDDTKYDLAMADVILMGFEDLGGSTTNAVRDYVTKQGLLARVPSHKTTKAGGLYSHSERLFPAIVSRLYFDRQFVMEIEPSGSQLRHEITDKGRAFLRNRLEKYVPDSALEAIQLHMNLGRSPQKAPPKDYSALDPARRRLDEAKVRTAFDAALQRFSVLPADAEKASHYVYMQENGGEKPFIYRTDRFKTVIRFSEDAHPFHEVYQEYVVKARSMSATLHVTVDYDGQEKPQAVEIKLSRQKVALVVTKPSRPAVKGIHRNPKTVHDTKQEPAKTSEADVRVRPDPSRQITMPLTLVKPGALLLADQVRILDDEIERVSRAVFQQREARLIERFELAQNQIELYIRRKVPANDPIPCPITIPSIDLANPLNPYHYVAHQYYEWATANGFDVVIDQISNGLSILFRPKRKALASPLP
jgi:hypothetical protein